MRLAEMGFYTYGSPEKRIAAVLHSRGREATQGEIATWIDEMHKLFIKRSKIEVDREDFADELADAIEDGNKTWTMCLHVRFGDAL